MSLWILTICIAPEAIDRSEAILTCRGPSRLHAQPSSSTAPTERSSWVSDGMGVYTKLFDVAPLCGSAYLGTIPGYVALTENRLHRPFHQPSPILERRVRWRLWLGHSWSLCRPRNIFTIQVPGLHRTTRSGPSLVFADTVYYVCAFGLGRSRSSTHGGPCWELSDALHLSC